MASELKPGALCGSVNLTTYRPMQPAGSSRMLALCGGCGATAEVKAWNRRAAAGEPAPLTWTREKPWQSGWYWIRVSNGWPTIIRVDQSDVDHPRLAFGRNIEFAGPIPKPEESKS
ncbi:MAG: hypothetical protein KGL39_49470 [Patescibacteria group bacterium]|nr:hypothetical protein [Patescibacteria group bacterium]